MLCIRELRVTACDMLGCHAGGLTHEQILKEILYLTTDEIRPYLAYAAPPNPWAYAKRWLLGMLAVRSNVQPASSGIQPPRICAHKRAVDETHQLRIRLPVAEHIRVNYGVRVVTTAIGEQSVPRKLP